MRKDLVSNDDIRVEVDLYVKCISFHRYKLDLSLFQIRQLLQELVGPFLEFVHPGHRLWVVPPLGDGLVDDGHDVEEGRLGSGDLDL